MKHSLLSIVVLVAAGCGAAPPQPSQLQIGEIYHPSTTELSALRNSANPFLRVAVERKLEADGNNQEDVSYLLSGFNDSPIEDLEPFARTLTDKLQDDLHTARLLVDEVGNTLGTIPFRTSLGKQVRSGYSDQGEISGILEDAQRMARIHLQRLAIGELPNDLVVEHNVITVLKTLLLYMEIVRNGQQNLAQMGELTAPLHLAYPDDFPDEVPFESYEAYGLHTGESKALFPNAGYVFGGDLIDGQNKGIDCSAFLSFATNSSVRLFTAYMEYVWMYANGRGEELDPRLLRDYLDYGLEQTIEEYETPAVLSPTDLQPGDLVVWRSAKAGHVSMVTGLWVDGEFVGVEATRKDDKSLEGLHFIRQQLFVDGLSTYVFRRRSF